MRIALGIPTINRRDLLVKALSVYLKNWQNDDIYIIDNGNQDLKLDYPSLNVITEAKNIGVSASWNKLMELASKANYTHVAILNDDIIWNKSPHEIEEFIKLNEASLYIGTGTWCCFVIPIAAYKMVGIFDEHFFPAYFEDMDYLYRMKLLGLNICVNTFFNPDVYRNSQSIYKNMELNNRFMQNKEFYKQKWGGVPGKEKYKKPFNGLRLFIFLKDKLYNLLLK